jgi:hypothetical protein
MGCRESSGGGIDVAVSSLGMLYSVMRCDVHANNHRTRGYRGNGYG